MIVIHAPGKLMIAGEYAVLGPDGEALAVAVEPGFACEATPAARWSLVRNDAGAEVEVPFTPDPTRTSYVGVPEAARFAIAAVDHALATLGEAPAPLRLVTRTLAAATGDRKPGVGGSAGASVVVAGAVLAAGGVAVSADRVLPVALAAHWAGQNGAGSGYDVATIAHGGLIRWRRALLAGPGAFPWQADALPWPPAFELIAGYSGRSAKTTRFVGRLEALAAADPPRIRRALGALGAPVSALGARLANGSVSGLLEGVRACHAALCAFDAELDLGILTSELTAMIAHAEAEGAAAKVSGAGGGDSVIALAHQPEVLAAVAERWRRHGFEPLPLVLAERGVRQQTGEPTAADRFTK